MILLLHKWDMAQRLVTSATQEGVSVARSIPNALDLLELSDYELAIVEPSQFPNWERLVPHVPLLFLGEVEGRVLERALQVGVRGVVGTGISLQGLKAALHTIREGGSVFPSRGLGEAVEGLREREKRAVSLSPRQREVLELTARGMNADQIGETLGVTGKYVNAVRAVVYRKLGIPKTGQGRIQAAVRWAVEHHLV
jgi:DNA-binding NarL/FixJ family response regulator